ncbi:MAG: DoxX family protein [Bryobacteraceae bacterium]|nr:DoxX family protein [Bryobacteraceae bacterium]
MEHSMAHPRSRTAPWEVPAWKTILSLCCAVLLGLAFIVAGTWKITDPLSAAARMREALLPAWFSLPAALSLGISETFAGVLLLVPRYRRWGAYLSGLLLIAFLGYFVINYNALRGEECNCFPWIKRTVGPAFIIGDLVMLAMAWFAGVWARPSESKRGAAIILTAVCVFAGVSYGMTVARESGLRAPSTIQVAGQPVALDDGRFFLYFFDPECSHCVFAAKEMSGYRWRDTRIIAIATAMPQFADQFLASTGLKADLSTDVEKLRETFRFASTPYGVALEDGRQKAAFPHFEGAEPERSLRELGFIE